MKKFFALVLALSMIFALCACGAANNTPAEGSDSTEKTTIKVMIWGTIDGRDELEKEWMAANPEIAEKYNVEYVLGGANSAECMDKIRLALASGENICDIAVLNYIQIPELARAGVIMDISDYYAPYEADICEAGKTLSQYDGTYIAVPSEIKTRVWYYRQDIFDECGVDATQVKTTDDFIAAGLKIQETYPNAKMFNLGPTAQPYDFLLTMSGNGASYFDEDGNYNLSTNEGIIACLEDYKKMIDAGIVSDSSDWTPDWENELADGTIVSVPSAAWMGNDTFLPVYSAENKGNWACTTWPAFGGATSGSDAGGQVWVVPSFSSCPEAAAEYMTWKWLSEESANFYFDHYKSITGICNSKVLNSDKVMTTPNDFFGLSQTKAQVEAANQFSIFNYSPNASAEQTIAMEYFRKAIYGEMTIEDALKAAEKDMTEQIGNAFK